MTFVKHLTGPHAGNRRQFGTSGTHGISKLIFPGFLNFRDRGLFSG